MSSASDNLENLHGIQMYGYSVDNGDVSAEALPAAALDRLNAAAKKSAVAVTIAGALASAPSMAEEVHAAPTPEPQSSYFQDDTAPFSYAGGVQSSDTDDPNCVGGGIKDTLNSINPFDGGLSLRKLANIGVAAYTGGASLAAGAVTNVGGECMFQDPPETRAEMIGQQVGKGALQTVANYAGDGSAMAITLPMAVIGMKTDFLEKPFIGGGHSSSEERSEATAPVSVAGTDMPSWQATAQMGGAETESNQSTVASAPWQALAKPSEVVEERKVYLDDRGYEIVDHQARQDGSKFGNAFIEIEQGGQTTWQSMAVKPGDQAGEDVAQSNQRSPSLGG